MASIQLHYLVVIISTIGLSVQDVTDNKINTQEDSPLGSIANELLTEKNLENIGGMVKNFIQSGGAQELINGVIENLASSEHSGQILGNIINSAGGASNTKEKNQESGKNAGDEINAADVISGIGSLVGAMQGTGGGGDKANPSAALLQGLGSLLAGANSGGGDSNAALLQGLGSLLGSAMKGGESKGRQQEDNDPTAALLQGLGSVLGAAASGNKEGGSGAEAILQGLGSLMNQGKDGGQGGLNPELIGNMINMFANSQSEKNENIQPVKTKPQKKTTSENVKSKTTNKPESQDDSLDLGYVITTASSLFKEGQGSQNFMDYLPMIMNTINAFTGEEAQQRKSSHSGHSWALPPVLERIHLYFDNFVNSEIGQQLFTYIGGQKAMKAFQNEKGNFDYDKFESLIENHSFRKHFIQQLTDKLVEILRLLSNDNTQNQYIDMGIQFTNSFLKNSGFPKKALLDLNRPVKSITNFANYAAKKYLDAKIDSREYVEPIVLYIQDLLKMAKLSLASTPKTKELSSKLADSINMEIIEPITRVNRGYRFAKTQPSCDKYVFCLVNKKESSSDSGSLSSLKQGLYKGSSLIAGWFLSSHTGTSYWDLYDVITGDKNCQVYHKEVCSGFFDEEIRATTEYIHNEL